MAWRNSLSGVIISSSARRRVAAWSLDLRGCARCRPIGWWSQAEPTDACTTGLVAPLAQRARPGSRPHPPDRPGRPLRSLHSELPVALTGPRPIAVDAEVSDPAGLTVVLVEDVITTGGALRSAAPVLRDGGATMPTDVCASTGPRRGEYAVRPAAPARSEASGDQGPLGLCQFSPVEDPATERSDVAVSAHSGTRSARAWAAGMRGLHSPRCRSCALGARCTCVRLR